MNLISKIKDLHKWMGIDLKALFFLFVLVFLFFSVEYLKDNKNEITPAKTCFAAFSATPIIIDQQIKDFGLEIKKINVLVPIIKNVNGKNKEEYNQSLREGVAHYDGTSLPDEGGNIFIFGHSSSDTVAGELGKIFSKIDDLEVGDGIKIYFENREFLYAVSEKEIVKPTDLSVLDKTKKETLTLMTCWPVGTKESRLIIRATRNN